jgi:branched-chain amino acid transport system ATP-binding protein
MNGVLEAQNVSMHFGGLKAVDNVSMTINKGTIFGIIGPNGAGKTTFFNVCSGIYTPTAGKIFLHGENITGLKPEQIARKGIARTFQNIKLFKYMTVLENVKIGFHTNTKTSILDALFHTKTYDADEEFVTGEGLKLLERVGLLQYKDTRAGNLPYGIQRRLEIARALALKPSILLLDEPAAGMNPNETQDLSAFIKDLNTSFDNSRDRGLTVVVIEHDMKFVMNTCNWILVLNFGEKICEGTPELVKKDKQVGEAYFGKGIITGDIHETA